MPKRDTDLAVSRHGIERMPLSPFREIDRLFEDFFDPWPRPFAELTPKVDIVDRDDEVLVRAELPGLRKEDVEISVSGDTLTLSGNTGLLCSPMEIILLRRSRYRQYQARSPGTLFPMRQPIIKLY